MSKLEGNAKSALLCNGASNHTDAEREQLDFYATEPKATQVLLEQETFSQYVWEPACGKGHISEVLKDNGYTVYSSDIVDRGYKDTMVLDFFKTNISHADIITNPPYKYAKEFVEHALRITPKGTKIAMFLKLTFLESKTRRVLFDTNPPKVVYVSSSRLQCAKNGDFETYKQGVGTAVAYAWYVWEKGYKGPTQLKWIN